MHIVGLLGMPRRIYTYPADLDWATYNLVETVGAFVTAAGILLLFGNLLVSARRGAAAGADPWHAATLEWTTSSPPPAYNYATIPTVSSAYPNWDDADRLHDRDNLEHGVRTLDLGHEQPATTPVEGDWDEIVEMPHDSPWPVLLAAAMTATAAMLLVGEFTFAAATAVLVVLALAGWHRHEPGESP